MNPTLSAAQLPELAALPGASVSMPSPFDAPPYLLVQSSACPVEARERETVAAWLLRQSCPVIAIGADIDDPWRDVYDVVVEDITAATPLLTHIERAPLAATVLVQTLRVTAGLPVAAALTIESLAYATLQGGREFRAWLKENPRKPSHTGFAEAAVQLNRQGDLLDIRLNRPERRNALSVDMRDALFEALQLLLADSTITRATLRGNGDCFSTGGDLDEFGSTPDPASAHAIRSLRLPSALLARCADRVECHLHGACIGAGIELPAFAQHVVASPKTFFQLPELRFGLIPGAGGCVSLPRRIGRQRTAWLALSCKRINAATALEWGLIDELMNG
ncbi:MAG: enoyl-CoA hydratase/isomerase family protein [Sterolibacterium sp.]|jgi:1,4-dihydroxy-2-naphthoyl-CoA synthase|nr:enoyl-CoA hydratase/isomerase family protein [Sterolibacterium sp.]